MGTVPQQGGEWGPHKLRARTVTLGRAAWQRQGQRGWGVHGGAGEMELHRRGAALGLAGSWPAALPPRHPSSPGTAAASEPSTLSTSGFLMTSSHHTSKRSKAFLVGKRGPSAGTLRRRAVEAIPSLELGWGQALTHPKTACYNPAAPCSEPGAPSVMKSFTSGETRGGLHYKTLNCYFFAAESPIIKISGKKSYTL